MAMPRRNIVFHVQMPHMPPPLFLLSSPAETSQPIIQPYLATPPSPLGRKLPNGGLIVTDEATPELLYKFTPWTRSALAFAEIDAYTQLEKLDDQSGVVRLLGVSGTQDHLVRVMERSHEGSLDRLLLDAKENNAAADGIDNARSILAQIALTMANIHALGLVHRDIKAENILMFAADSPATRGERVRAKVSDFDRMQRLATGDWLTEPVGSLFHMAPELLAGQRYDRKVDVYAFGILIFEVAHGGARPYLNVATGMPGSIPRAEFSGKVVSDLYRPDWRATNESLRDLAMRCWAADPAERPEFTDIAARLLEAPHASPPRATAAAIRARTDHRALHAVGFAASIGQQRRSMEDAACVLATGSAIIAGVFDGFRGARTSTFAARRFALSLAATLDEDPLRAEAALRTTFESTEAALRRLEPPIECGSTATVAVFQDHGVTLAWLGDSPAYLLRKDQAPALLVTPHHPDRADEAAQVAANGGEIRREQTMLESGELIPWGPLRVFVPASEEAHGIALSRALGFFSFKPAIASAPDVVRLPRHDDDRYLVIASDGVSAVLSPEAVHGIIASSPSVQASAEAIIDAVLNGGAPDNASVIVVDLQLPPEGVPQGYGAGRCFF